MSPSRYAQLALILLFTLWSTSLGAMSLAPAPLKDLIKEADLVVRGVILKSEVEAISQSSPSLRTRYTFWIWEHHKAPPLTSVKTLESFDTLDFLQPGGTRGTLTTRVPGITLLAPGDTLVLLLKSTPWGLQPLGYPLGIFFLDPKGGVQAAWPGHDSLEVMRVFGHTHPQPAGSESPLRRGQ